MSSTKTSPAGEFEQALRGCRKPIGHAESFQWVHSDLIAKEFGEDECLDTVVDRTTFQLGKGNRALLFRWPEVRRKTREVVRKLVGQRPADLVGSAEVSHEQLNARSPLMVTGQLVIEAEKLGAVSDQRGGMLQVGKAAVENRPHRLEVETARQLEALHPLEVGLHRDRPVLLLHGNEAVAARRASSCPARR